MKDKIGIGMIGTGFARLTQIPSFAECEGAEVVSVASASIRNAERVARDFGIGHFTCDWKETVERDDVDLVSITTPPNLHCEMASYTIENGKHVLCEKPMAMSVTEAEKMLAAADEAGVLALVDHELRFLNGRQKANSMIRAGDIGKITHVKCTFRNASRGTPEIPWNWWSDSGSGGGALGAIGSHAIDSFRWILGAEIADVFCLLATHVKERRDAEGISRSVTTDDEANLILRMKDSEFTRGATGTGSFSVVESGKYDFWMEIYGSRGSLIVGESGELKISKMGENDWREVPVELGTAAKGTRPGGWSRGFLAFAQEIVSSVREGRIEIPNAATFRDGVAVQKVLDAARESARKGMMVRV